MGYGYFLHDVQMILCLATEVLSITDQDQTILEV